MFSPLGLNHIHNTRAATNHLLDIPQGQTTHYGTYSMRSIASSALNDLQRNTIENLTNKKLVNSKRSYSKHTLLSTATNLQLTCFSTILSRQSPTLLEFFSFLFLSFSSFFLLFISSFSIVIIIPSSSFFTFSKDTYLKNYFFYLIVRWIMSTTCLKIVAEIYF